MWEEIKTIDDFANLLQKTDIKKYDAIFSSLKEINHPVYQSLDDAFNMILLLERLDKYQCEAFFKPCQKKILHAIVSGDKGLLLLDCEFFNSMQVTIVLHELRSYLPDIIKFPNFSLFTESQRDIIFSAYQDKKEHLKKLMPNTVSLIALLDSFSYNPSYKDYIFNVVKIDIPFIVRCADHLNSIVQCLNESQNNILQDILLDNISKFKKIYSALKDNQSSWFKSEFLSQLEGKTIAMQWEMIQSHASKRPGSRTEIAFNLLKKYYSSWQCDQLMREIYVESFAASAFYSRSTACGVTFFNGVKLKQYLIEHPESLKMDDPKIVQIRTHFQ